MMMMAESGHPPPTGWPRACATCGSVPSTIFCRVDSTYLCSSCDARVHAVSLIASRHERVWMCEACGRSPAAFACKADSAILCASCDATIHSANSLAQRHVRVPVPPVPNCNKEEEDHGEDEDVEPWLLLGEARNGSQGLEVDEFLDLGRFMDNPIKIGESDGSDGVVPTMLEGSEESKNEEDRQRFDFGIEHEDIKEESLDYTIPILNHSILMSSLEGGVVPGIAVAAMPYGSGGPPEGIMVDLFAGKHAGLPAQVPPYMDREARVLRYREKRKTRKFEKTIRYASRKAYAEVRPRIKGRFAKSSDSDVEQLFSSASAAAYDIVPSF